MKANLCVVGLGLAGCLYAAAALAEWELRRGDAASPCRLDSAEQVVFDGYQDAKVRLAVTATGVRLTASSSLDAEFGDIALKVDKQEAVGMDRLADAKSAVFDSQYGHLIEQFIAGHLLTATLRFWPTWPTTGPHTVSFSLTGFTKALQALRACASASSSP